MLTGGMHLIKHQLCPRQRPTVRCHCGVFVIVVPSKCVMIYLLTVVVLFILANQQTHHRQPSAVGTGKYRQRWVVLEVSVHPAYASPAPLLTSTQHSLTHL